MTKKLPQVDVNSGLLHESPNGWLWQIYADLDTGRMLVLRSRPDGSYLPDWHTNVEAYEQYRALNPTHELPDLSDSPVGSAAQPIVTPAEETGEIDSSHAGTGNLRWTVEGVDPDYRVPVGSPVPFDSAAILGEAVSASDRVEGSGAPVYREGDRSKGLIGAVGPDESSGAPPEEAIVTILEGNPRVETDGRPTAEHGSMALIQSSTTGSAGALGRLHTEMDQLRWEIERYSGDEAESNIRADIAAASENLVRSNQMADEAHSALDRHLSQRKDLPFLAKFFNIGEAAEEHNRQTRLLHSRTSSADAGVAFQQARLHRLSDQLNQLTGQSGPMMSGPLSGSQRHVARLIAQQEASEARVDVWRKGIAGGLAFEAGASVEVSNAINNIASAGGGPTASTSRGPQGVHYSQQYRGQYVFHPGAFGSPWRNVETHRFVSKRSVPWETRVRSALDRGEDIPAR